MYADISHVLEGGKNEGDKLLLRFHNKRIVKYVSFQLFNGETGDKTSGRPIFSKFIGSFNLFVSPGKLNKLSMCSPFSL